MLLQHGRQAGIIENRPPIGKRPIDRLKILPTSIESSQHIFLRNVMSAVTNARRDAL
jgi:hypothetical protein